MGTRRGFLRGGLAGAALAACGPAVRGSGPLYPSLDDDVGQLLWVGLAGTTVVPAVEQALARGAIGGVVLFRRNFAGLAELRALCDALHAAAAPSGTPVLIAADQEGGRVQPFRAPATVWPAMARLGERARIDLAAATALARRIGGGMGAELAALGVDVNLAPVLDVRVEPKNQVIGDRALSDRSDEVVELGTALVRGLADASIVACGKHFPGHGGSVEDSHFDLPVSQRTRIELEDEIMPWGALATELRLVMSAHVVYPALRSDLPATLEPRILGDLLRGHLGYQGVVLSDDLAMGAISRRFPIEEAALRALAAGCDALLVLHQPAAYPRARRALLDGARRYSNLRARVTEAAARVRALKTALIAEAARPPLAVVGSAEHLALAAELAG